ncbi:hypothetical protein GCM10009764_16000 [Nocardia ninae]|uniref:Uncharacterized protein n=1 Tax=Nocardia ninae NBRC 108245 TaxID=1210091 RepID=A0A511MIX4_9NOCA|nr:hypothetical protein NN4_45870 [Nocardia ninae NBRC 108245]
MILLDPLSPKIGPVALGDPKGGLAPKFVALAGHGAPVLSILHTVQVSRFQAPLLRTNPSVCRRCAGASTRRTPGAKIRHAMSKNPAIPDPQHESAGPSSEAKLCKNPALPYEIPVDLLSEI